MLGWSYCWSWPGQGSNPAAGVYAHNHSSTDKPCSVWLLPPLQRASLHQNSMLNATCIEDVVYLPKAIQWNPKSNIIHNV